MAEGDPATPWLAARQQLKEFADSYAGLAADFCRQVQSPQGGPSGMQSGLVERYRQLFAPFALPDAAPAGAAPAFARYQQAAERFGRQVSSIAVDASRRLAEALASTDPAAAPITSLRELHELWIDCGEAAYAEAAHRSDFADAQAELLAAFVELRAGQLRP